MRKRIVLLLLTALTVSAAPQRANPNGNPLVPQDTTSSPVVDTTTTTPPGASSTPPAQPGASNTPASPSGPPPQQPNPSTTASATNPLSSSSPPLTLPSSTPSQTSQTSTTDSPPPSETTSASIVSDSNGGSSTVFVTVPASTSDAADSSTPVPSSSQAPDNSNNGGGGGGVGMGTIIGLSVAGGVAALAIIGFIIWKLTRKRFPDFDTENNEAIKWPELNNTHGASTMDDLSRAPSTVTADPYAVPPLPQFNPNQPYRDDPRAGSVTGYYDPYRGPIPQTFQDEMGENIQMSTYPPRDGPASNQMGRASPVPGRMGTPLAAGVGRTISPAPGATLGGPQYVPGAQPEMARYHSPGPNPYS